MLALVIVVAALLVGLGAIRRLDIPVTRLEEVALSSAIGLVVAPWTLLATVRMLGFSAGVPAGATLLAGAALGLRPWRAGALREPAPRTSAVSWAALGVLFAFLFHSTMADSEPGGLYTGGSVFGDLALHLTLISRFTATPGLSLESPLVAGTPLTYPFLGDFFPACLVRAGWSVSTSLVVTGWLSIMTALALVQAIALRLFRRPAAATLAAWLLVLNGSIAGAWYAFGDLLARGLPASLGDLPDYAHLRDRGIVVSNLVSDFYLPQRALLCALPAFWAIVWLIQAAVRRADGGGSCRRPMIGAALVTGGLPFVHVHSFLVALGLLGWFALWRVARRRPEPGVWLAAPALALAIAAPQLAWQFGHSWSGGFSRWNPGWLTPAGGSFWWFWLRNWGIALLLVPVGFVVIRRLTRDDFAMPFYLALLVVFAAANLYQFQPHLWDNTKFLLYAYMAVALIGAGGIAHWLAAGRLRRIIAGAAIVGLTTTGALSVARLAGRHDRLATADDLALAGRLREILPVDAVVLANDDHNHVVPMLTGRRVVMGYRGWLWTHGIDYRPLERDVVAMLQGAPDTAELLRRHRVTHVLIGPRERRWGAEAEWFRARYPRIYVDATTEVFAVTRGATALARR